VRLEYQAVEFMLPREALCDATLTHSTTDLSKADTPSSLSNMLPQVNLPPPPPAVISMEVHKEQVIHLSSTVAAYMQHRLPPTW